jgi:hypothetical protein
MARMKRYEYKTMSLKVTGAINKKFDSSEMNNDLNALGAQGWELVSVSTLTCVGDTVSFVAFLKRETGA